MTARKLVAPLVALAVGLVLAAACGGDGDGRTATGRLTDPRSVPTATPPAQQPEPFILGPEVLTPIPREDGGGEENGGADGGQVTPGECGETYTVQSGDVPYSIAEKCGVDPAEVASWVNELLDLNGIDDPTTLRVGQELKIPQ